MPRTDIQAPWIGNPHEDLQESVCYCCNCDVGIVDNEPHYDIFGHKICMDCIDDFIEMA